MLNNENNQVPDKPGELYTTGKKASVVVVHQFFVIMMVCSIFAAGFCIRKHEHTCVELFSVMSVMGLAGGFVALAYLTNVTGRKSSNDYTIYYTNVDKVYSDILICIFFVLISFILKLIRSVSERDFDFGSLMIVSGCFSYLIDAAFLMLYNSIVRKVKGGVLIKHSFSYKCIATIKAFMRTHDFELSTGRGKERAKIQNAVEAIAAGALDTTLNVEEFHGQNRSLAEAINHIQEGLSTAVTESTKNERMKADLITNVSHDIKTPLTSIVNYVDLLKRENLNNKNAEYYIRVIDDKSQRLKQLTEDLVEASKISSGNIKLDMQKIDMLELLYQTGGEFNERFEARNLTIVTKLPQQSCIIEADGRQLYRAIENLYTNAAKYALENTRVYVELQRTEDSAIFTIKNVSKDAITYEQGNYQNITDRFVRGEVSRTTEGSGLGLSIAKNLTSLMGGEFEIKVDGDLFIARISFKMA